MEKNVHAWYSTGLFSHGIRRVNDVGGKPSSDKYQIGTNFKICVSKFFKFQILKFSKFQIVKF